MLQSYLEEISTYIPRDVTKSDNYDYINHYSRAVILNGDSDLFAMSYFAFHILWMSFLQKVTYTLFVDDPDGTKAAFSNEGNVVRELEMSQGLYDLSILNEKKLCYVTKHPLIGWHQNRIANLVNLIEKRDHIAHCSGVLDLDQMDIEDLARKCIRYTDEIQQKLNNVILSRWKKYLVDTKPTAEGGYSLVHDWVVDYMLHEHLSVKDMSSILSAPMTYGDNFELIALYQLALYAEDLDTSNEYGSDSIKATLIKDADDNLRLQLKDELEAFMQHR